MSTRPKDPNESLPLTPAAFQIMLALSGQERHGYGIMQEVLERTEGTVRLGAGTMYGSIKRLVEFGWIEESGERPAPDTDDERRRYYRLTSLGRRVAELEAERLEQLVRQARAARLLPGGAS